jgi:3-hydroxyacyl-[acyl-carrier-protein] dehydratase
MNIEEIKRIVPHRYPFLLLDRIVEFDAHKRIVAIKNVTANEPFFQGHFPHYMVMPGVLIIEAMAQAAGVLGLKSKGLANDGESIYFFAGIDKARFKRPVVPGDTLLIEVTLVRTSRGLSKLAATAHVGGVLAAEAEILCVLRPIPVSEVLKD